MLLKKIRNEINILQINIRLIRLDVKLGMRYIILKKELINTVINIVTEK